MWNITRYTAMTVLGVGIACAVTPTPSSAQCGCGYGAYGFAPMFGFAGYGGYGGCGGYGYARGGAAVAVTATPVGRRMASTATAGCMAMRLRVRAFLD